MTISKDVTKRPMMLTKREVEAVASYRVNKEYSKTTNRLTLVMLVFALAGLFLYRSVNQWAGMGVFMAGFAVLFWQFYVFIPKKQKVAKEQLVKMWRGS